MSNPFKILDEVSLRWHHIKMMLVAAVGTFTDGYDLTMLGLVLTPLLASFGISNIKSSIGVFWATWLNALPIFGFLIGAPVFGYLANKGRKRFYGVDVALMSIGAGLQFIAQSLVELAIFRFMMGIGLGADYVLSPMMVAEHSNARDRGRLLAIGFGGFWVFGALVASLLALMFKVFLNSDLYWRVMLASGAIPPLIVIYLRRRFPETPRYLARIAGDVKEFSKVVRQVLKADVGTDITLRTDDRGYGELLRSYIPYMLLGASLWYLFDIPAYGQGFFITYIANNIGYNNPALMNIISIGFTYLGALIFWLTQPRLGSKVLQAVGFGGMAASFFVFAYLMHASLIGVISGILLFSLAKFFGQVGPGSVVAVGAHGVELSPTKVRGIGQAINVLGGRLGVLTTTFVLPALLAANSPYAYVFLGAVSLIGVALTVLFVPETANKGLEEASMEFIH